MICLWKDMKSDRNKLVFVLAVTFVWGMFAHGYRFVHNSFYGDSLNEFSGGVVKLHLGRVAVPLYRAILRTDFTLPWMIGILSLLWIGLAVFFIVRLFKIESKGLIILTVGIFTVNNTVTALAAGYLHDLDVNMFAMLCSVLAVYFWNRGSRADFFLGALCVAVSLGIYQSFLSVTIVLIMYMCIVGLLKGEQSKTVFLKGLKGIGMLIFGGILYIVTMNAVLRMMNIKLSTSGYNSLYNMTGLTIPLLISLTIGAYVECIEKLMGALSIWPPIFTATVVGVTCVFIGFSILHKMHKNKISVSSAVLCVLLIGLLPMGMNISYILNRGIAHDLMVYAVWLFYFQAVILAEEGIFNNLEAGKAQWLKKLCLLLVLVMLYGNTQLTNLMYVKKEMETDSFKSYMNRVLSLMETTEDYIPGVTPVVFVGQPEYLDRQMDVFDKYYRMTGSDSAHSITVADAYRVRTFFSYILNTPIKISDNDIYMSMQTDSRVKEMQCYPNKNCVSMIGDVMVVKLD